MYQLREYQQKAVNAACDYFNGKYQKPALIVMPTGSGKSLIIAEIARKVDAPLIVLQPTKEILEQNYNKMMDYQIQGVDIYSASCNKKNIGNITLATIGSIVRNGKVADVFSSFEYVIMDECHYMNPKMGVYKTFYEAIGGKWIGLTATPYRLAHNSFGSILRFLTRTNPRVFSKVIHVTQTKYLSELGYFSPTEYFSIKGFNRSEIRLNSTGADYLEESERNYYDKTEFNKKIIKVVKRLLEIGKTRILIFTKFVNESRDLAAELGSVAATVDGEMKSKERDAVIKGFKSGDIKVVCNVGVLTTGFDYPELECVVIARPTRSLTLYYQMLGRCVRPHPAKEKAWIVDMCNNIDIFGHVEDMQLVEFNDNIWSVISKGRQLTNVYLNEVMSN